ncbi:hypothetical protein EXIGLDRAFT_731444 [Exidia glandulosa HHB12029]|uniref:RhoGAP-domain-containing protein n=1 Tax=Exidia glandulosa HHB12029 TaxID=1314781 RepID=A0A165L0J4_EXIGL|nr:hypothetical protein EXIGLDRAFT_731444 [Exidia glandulosa HHB12029]
MAATRTATATTSSSTKTGSSSIRTTTSKTSSGSGGDKKEAWGANFWVTLADPQSGAEFYACPATGAVSWDPPEGNFVLPRSSEGEWWEIEDATSGLSYYYHTKTSETVWTRPEGFVIPLSMIQSTTLGKRLSAAYLSPRSSFIESGAPKEGTIPEQLTPPATPVVDQAPASPVTSQYRSPVSASGRKSASRESPPKSHHHRREDSSKPASPSRVAFALGTPDVNVSPPTPNMRAQTPSRQYQQQQRPPVSGHPTPLRVDTAHTPPSSFTRPALPRSGSAPLPSTGGGSRMRSKSSTQLRNESGPGGQSLQAAAELFVASQNQPQRHGRSGSISQSPPPSAARGLYSLPKASASAASLGFGGGKKRARAGSSGSGLRGVVIGAPVLDPEATKRMAVGRGTEAVVVPLRDRKEKEREDAERIGFPRELAEEIQQFAGSDFARQYFAKHSTGLIFKRRVPIEKMMVWQKAPLTTPLLNINRAQHKDAVRIFRAIQKVMGDATPAVSVAAAREEERWVLGEGIAHGELRDEIYCQLLKQLSANPNPQGVFKGWQMLCVMLVTFPPSKNFETYLQGFIERHLALAEGRIDVMAKYCLRRLPIIARKGPKGKAPSVGEIESASDAAFNPSTFGEPLDAIMRLQTRSYPTERVPIVLPFLADGILALDGTRAEGIFRVPGDGDAVAELKLRIDRGFYTLDGIDDPHVPASLLKLWLRELQEPLVPDELYNECVAVGARDDALGAVQLVARLPTHNRRVVAFVVSFLQLFLEDRVTSRTKMTAPNLALVMAPNLVRCASESAAVVFANAQHEQRFVLNLLLNLHCDEIDPDFRPQHGRGAAVRSRQHTA